jgi:hypothetical protein
LVTLAAPLLAGALDAVLAGALDAEFVLADELGVLLALEFDFEELHAVKASAHARAAVARPAMDLRICVPLPRSLRAEVVAALPASR